MALDFGDFEFLKLELRDHVLVVTLNAPENMNALTPPRIGELTRLFHSLDHNVDVRAVLLTGAGRNFSAGGDLKAMLQRAWGGATDSPRGRRLVLELLEVEQPLVAAVNGAAVGLAANIALLCDAVFVGESARLGDTHVKIGLVAGDGGALIWPLLCGVNRAKHYLMTGDLVGAVEAERIGLVNEVVPDDDLFDRAFAYAQRLANGPIRAIWGTKFSINKMLRQQMNLLLDTSMTLERLTMVSDDHHEAVHAFLEKRPAQFSGR
ncbi:MAG: enoyl-CoA hydratase/isomerase family protein [Chloroflexi bacterium]|nr:enoyl-CoA hydratase/isomerase family protein [Chloroflexota bacterium]